MVWLHVLAHKAASVAPASTALAEVWYIVGVAVGGVAAQGCVPEDAKVRPVEGRCAALLVLALAFISSIMHVYRCGAFAFAFALFPCTCVV